MKKKIIFILTIITLISSLSFAAGYDNFKIQKSYKAGVFNDIKPEDWYYNNIKVAYEYGLINGKLENKFDPDGKLTWAEAIKLAATLNSIYLSQQIPLNDHLPWYQSYTDYAIQAGIINAEPSNYEAEINRLDFADIFMRALPSSALTAINRVDDGLIPDVPITAEKGPSVYALYRAGIVKGSNKAGAFLPNSSINRSEVATIITRMALPNTRTTVTLIKAYSATGYMPEVYPLKHTMYVGQKGFVILNDKEGKVANVAIKPINQAASYVSASWGQWHQSGNNIILCHLEAKKAGEAQFYVRSLTANDEIMHEELLTVRVLADLPTLDQYYAPDFVKIFNPYVVAQNNTGNRYTLSFQPSSLSDDNFQKNSLESYKQLLTSKYFRVDQQKSNSNSDYFSKNISGVNYNVKIDYSREASNIIDISFSKE